MEGNGIIVGLYAAVLFISKLYVCTSADVSVSTRVGTIVGFRKEVPLSGQTKMVKQFLGIPYAAPQDSSTRFTRAKPNSERFDNYNATYYRAFCPQNKYRNPSVEMFKVSEDCLHLNIFTPNVPSGDSSGYAVMIWLYGGSFSYGSAEYYSGEVMSSFRDVIVVTLNYRVGVFGFLSAGDLVLPGNLGLWDQHLAIKWVHDNIAEFGGDPKAVTLFGESAGAASCMLQATYKDNAGYFRRIISESGSSLAPWAGPKDARNNFVFLKTTTGCTNATTGEVVECLRSKSMDDLIDSMTASTTYGPAVDGEFIIENPSAILEGNQQNSLPLRTQFVDLDFLSGVNNKESAPFVGAKQDLSEGLSMLMFTQVFVPSIVDLLQVDDSLLLNQAIIHQYTSYGDPSSLTVRDNAVDFVSDIQFISPAVRAARAHVTKGTGSTYVYVFSHRFSLSQSPSWVDGASHTEEIPFVLGFPDSLKLAVGIPIDTPVPIQPEEISLMVQMMTYWTNFAKTGDPNNGSYGQTLPEWPQYSLGQEQYMNFDLPNSTVGSKFEDSRMTFWTRIVPGITSCMTECEDCRQTAITSSGTSVDFAAVQLLLGLFVNAVLVRL